MAYYRRQLGLDAAILTRATAVFERALGDGEYLTRTELGALLDRPDLVAKGVRLLGISLSSLVAEEAGDESEFSLSL